MSEAYIYYAGNPDCPHDDVSITTLTVSPPITEWVCNNSYCGRRIRQVNEPTKVTMPEAAQKIPDSLKVDGDWIYRTDYLHGEEEEIPDEFSQNDDLVRAWKKYDWYRALYEISVQMRYNTQNGRVELLGVEGKELPKPVTLLP